MTQMPPSLRVPMLDLARQYAPLRHQLLAAVTDALDSQHLILGPAVEQLEAAIAPLCGSRHALGCASGTDALWLALAAAGVGPGDAVVTTPFSFFATASSIVRAGAVPLFADIDPRTFNLAPAAVETLLRRVTTARPSLRIRALLPVHLYGQPADMDALAPLASHYGLHLIEDAAQAIGATWNTRPAGSLGDAAAFSFYPTKNLNAAGDAGLVSTSSDTLLSRARMLRSHGSRQRYLHEELGWNARIDAVQAAVLSVKLPHLPAWNTRRLALARRYDQLLTATGLVAPLGSTSVADGLVLPWTDPRAGHVFHQYVLRAPDRDRLREHLLTEGISSEVYYPIPLHQQPALAPFITREPLPEAERASREVLALPIFPELEHTEQDAVVDAIVRFYAG